MSGSPRTIVRLLAAGGLPLLLSGVWLGAAATSAEEPAGRAVASSERAVRLPNHFGKLSLSDKQTAEVYAVIRRFRSEIDPLEARLEQLRRDQQAAVEGLLSTEQRKQLETLRADSKSKSGKAATDKPSAK